MLKIPVDGTRYSIEVDQRKDDCCKEPPHCHVLENGIRVAQYVFRSARLNTHHRFAEHHLDKIYRCIDQHENDLIREYERIANS